MTGLINVIGGAGTMAGANRGGGGAGGRISLHAQNINTFGGTLVAQGGVAPILTQAGGPGTSMHEFS